MDKHTLFKYWDSDQILKIDLGHALEIGFDKADAEWFSEFGIPAWVAPNIWIYEPRKYNENYISIGEDRNERKILYSKKDRSISSLNDDRFLYICTGLENFIKMLYFYADMIEIAINSDKYAATKNRIPLDIVRIFLDKILFLDSNSCNAGSFWEEELHRRGM